MIEEVEVVIPTLFRPVTLEPLVAALHAQGVEKVAVLEGMPVNDAWRKGYAEATKRYLMILNDDIEISPHFVNEMLYAHGIGGTFVYGCRADRFTGISRSMRDHAVRGAALGEAFSMDMLTRVPPIPDVFRIYHGDDWFYFQHQKHGKCMEAVSAQYRGEYSYSSKHPDIERVMNGWFGVPFDVVARREHLASREHFIIPNALRWYMDHDGIDGTVSALDTNRAFIGSPAGLLS